MTHAICRLTAKNWDQLRNPTLGNRVWATFTFFVVRTFGVNWRQVWRNSLTNWRHTYQLAASPVCKMPSPVSVRVSIWSVVLGLWSVLGRVSLLEYVCWGKCVDYDMIAYAYIMEMRKGHEYGMRYDSNRISDGSRSRVLRVSCVIIIFLNDCRRRTRIVVVSPRVACVTGR